MSLRVGVREPLPRLGSRVAAMVAAAGHVPVDDAPDVLLVCMDSPAVGWDPLANAPGVPVIASAIRELDPLPVAPVGTLRRPFGVAALRHELDRLAAALLRSPLEAAAAEIADSIDVFAALDDPSARVEAVVTILRSHLGGD